ncbi:ribonuclease H-like domain-containing protein [Tanacetum coccineum]
MPVVTDDYVDLKVKVIGCDNGTEFKNRVMNQFCEMKGIKREFSVARTPQQNGNGPNWLFDIDALTKSMNYEPVVAGNQSNGIVGIKECEMQVKLEWRQFSDAGFKPLGEEEKDAKDLENEDSEVPNTKEPRVNQEQDENVNNTNNINTVSLTVNAYVNIEKRYDDEGVDATG